MATHMEPYDNQIKYTYFFREKACQLGQFLQNTTGMFHITKEKTS